MAERRGTLALLFIGLISGIGVLLSVYSVYEYIVIASGLDASSSLCKLSAEFDCEAAVRSPWSTFLGLPLGLYGAAFYLFIIGFALASSDETTIGRARSAGVILVFGVLSVCMSAVLFLVLKLSVKVYCPVCLSIYLVNILLLVFSAWWGWGQGLGNLLSVGIRSILAYPAVVLRPASQFEAGQTVLARLGFFAILLGIFSVQIMPHWLANRFVSLNVEQAQLDQAISEWSAQPVDSFALSGEDALNKDYAKGPSDAPIQIVEFTDFECPACRMTYLMLDEIIADYPDRVRVILRNFPLDKSCNAGMPRQMHPNACFAAEYVRCAGEQDKFWEAIDLIMGLEELDQDRTVEQIKQAIRASDAILGLDSEAVSECLNSGRQRRKIVSDIAEGERLGISGTPSIWINGRRWQAIDEGAIRTLFDVILNESVGQRNRKAGEPVAAR